MRDENSAEPGRATLRNETRYGFAASGPFHRLKPVAAFAAFVIVWGCAAHAADEEETPFTRLAKLATYLSENDAAQAIDCFDSHMQGYSTIEADINALGAQTDVLCAIDIVSEDAAGSIHKLDTDWFIELRSQADGGPVERRRERVRLEMRKEGAKWLISAMSPLDILAPIHIQ